MVLAVVEDCSILLIKAKRHLLGKSYLGTYQLEELNKGEKPSDAASREMGRRKWDK